MPLRIEDYALIGDCETAALVGRNGSIDWYCPGSFDAPACFAALLGTREHGRWLIAPKDERAQVRRSYRDGTLVLETIFSLPEGEVALIDCMPFCSETTEIVRVVEGRRGTVRMHTDLVIRCDYGSVIPWVRRKDDGLWAIAGPDSLQLVTDVELVGENFHTVGEFTVSAGQQVPFSLTWYPSHRPTPVKRDPLHCVADTETWWRDWARQCQSEGPWADAVLRSLITLKAMTYLPTGGLVAAVTTSLPEWIGGVRNWDYRYCWLRDATFTLYALMDGGYIEEARAWREWLLRAVAGKPSDLHIMYGLRGERRLTELELPWLPGYENSAPVRIGNAASEQHQLDVYGEVMDTLHHSRKVGLEESDDVWRVQGAIMKFLETDWQKPDDGIWEVRGPSRQFTHSKVMAWVAADRAIKSVEQFHLKGPVERWRRLRDEIHAQVCREGFNSELNSFVQAFGSDDLDASLLMMPLVGFLPPEDPRIRGTIEAIERGLTRNGLVDRYRPQEHIDGLPPREGAFLLCTFWLADCLALVGRVDDARRLFAHLLDLRNDVGLLSEQYDPVGKRMLGNFPQAFSHVGLINTARNLTKHGGPAEKRKK